MSKPTPTSRIKELDALRGIGAAMVVLFHYTSIYDRNYDHPGTLIPNVNLGYYGVHLFFLVSGFVIYMTLQRTTGAQHFIISRITRLYPVYWVAVLITVAVAFLSAPITARSVGESIANLTMLQEYAGIRHLDGVYWTLSVELAFYAWMFAFWRIGLLSRPLRMFLVWIVANGVILGLAVALGSILGTALPRAVYIGLITGHGNLFFAGIGFYCWRQQRSTANIVLILLTLVLELAFDPGAILVTLTLYGLFALVVTNRLRIIAARPLLYLGAISYPLYLIHQHIGYIVIRQLYAAQIDNPLLILGIPIAVVLLLAAAIHHGIETPALRILRTRLLNRPDPTPIDKPTVSDNPPTLARAS